MSVPLTKPQVDQAAPLDFTPRQRPIAVTVKARVNGLECELSLDATLDQLQQITRRLVELGAEPASAPAAQQQPKPKAQPAYSDGGEALCPVHRRQLRGPNQWGKLYCTARDGDDYCKYTYKAE